MAKPICFIIQKFDNGFFDELYDDVIEIAVNEANALCVRADKILGAKPPLEKVRSFIDEAAICIAEVTENNPNVFFEAGWAFALKKPIFVLWDKSKRTEGLPFDIHDKVGIPYDSSKSGWRKELREKLVENIAFELTYVPESNPSSNITIAGLLNKYLPYCDKHTSPRTYESYSGHIRNFLKHMGECANEPASSLSPTQVEEWLYNQKSWGPAYTRGAIVALQVAYNWAVERKHISENPIKNMEKPKAAKRNRPMPLDVFKKILAKTDENDSFRDVLILVWNTDCRPEEVRHLEARYVDIERKFIRMPQGIGRTGQKSRVIHLNEKAIEVLGKLVEKYPKGPLFLNTRGKPWTKFSLCNRLHRYSKAIGEQYALSDCRNGVLSNIAA